MPLLQDAAITSPGGSWRESWSWAVTVVSDYDHPLYETYSELGGCTQKTILKLDYAQRVLQKRKRKTKSAKVISSLADEQCQQCTQICLPEWGIWHRNPNKPNSITVLKRLCAWVYIPETTTPCAQYAVSDEGFCYFCRITLRWQSV